MKKIFIPEEWANIDMNKNDNNNSLECQYDKSHLDNIVENIITRIEKEKVDIAPTYHEWCILGFALGNEFGDNGRTYYHRISIIHTDYSENETDKQFTKCLKSQGSGITIKTFFYLVQKAGISINYGKFQNGYLDKRKNGNEKSVDNAIYPNIQKDEKQKKWIKEEKDLPTFEEDVYSSLPPFIKKCIDNAISKDDRATILLGTIVCLSTCFSQICGVYDDRIVYPNLYFFLVAKAGMGKGSLSLCRLLLAAIDEELKTISKKEYDSYKEEMKNYNSLKNKSDVIPPIEPNQLALIIPANSSAAAFQKILADNDGIGLIFETEGDTLSQTLKSDYGNYSDSLRKAFHHEPISFSRRTDRVFINVEHPRLSAVLAGTPEQVSRLIPNAENGLLSRFIFFSLPFKREIRNVFLNCDIENSKDNIFKKVGEEFKEYYDTLKRAGTFNFQLSQMQQVKFLEYLQNTNEECCDEVDNGFQGVVRRLGLIAYRIMMTLTMSRMLNKFISHNRNDTTNTILECTTEDFEITMSILKTLTYHSVFMYRTLNSKQENSSSLSSKNVKKDKRMILLDSLNQEFDKQQYIEATKKLGYIEDTTDKWINSFINKGQIERNGQGKYKKITQKEPND